MSELASAQASTSPGIRGITLQDAGRGAAVAVAGSWVGYFLFTGMPQLTLEVFPRTLVVHILIGVLALAYVAWLAAARRLPGGTPLDFAVLGFVAAFALATYMSINWRVSLEATLQVGAAIIVFYALTELPGLTAANLARMLMLIGGALSLYALWVVGGDYADYLRLTRSVEGLRASNIFPPSVLRVHDVSDHTNVLAMLLVLITPFFALSAAFARARAERVAALIALAIAATALFLTLSRGGWAGAGVAVAFVIAGGWLTVRVEERERAGDIRWSDVIPRVNPTAVAAVGGALALVVIGTLGFLASTSTRPGWLFRSSLSPRRDAWSAGWHIFTDHILTGAGPNSFALLYDQYSGRFPVYTQHAHNGFLQLADDAGVLGLLALVGIIAAAGYMLWRTWRRGTLEQRLLAVACTGALLGFAVHNTVDAGNVWKAPAIALAVVAAILARGYLEALSPPAVPPLRERMNATSAPRFAVGPPRFAVGLPRFAVGLPRFAVGAILLALIAVPFVGWYVIDRAHHDYWLAMDDFADRGDANGATARAAALREMQSAVNADSSMAVYQLQLGQMQATTYVEAGSRDSTLVDAAVVHLERAVALDPRSDLAHADLARAYALAGKDDRAADEAAKARVIARNHWQPVLLAGEVYEDIGRSADAVDTYGQALSIDATLATSDYWQMTAFRTSHFDEIISHSSLGINACTHGAYLVEAHRTAVSTSLAALDDDRSKCSLLVFSSPHDLVQRVNYAKILMQQGDAAAALEHLDYAVQRQPDFGPARTELGRWYAAQGNTDAARHEWVLGGQLDEAESLLLLGQSYPHGQVPSSVSDRLRQVAGPGGAQQQVDLLAILYYRMKYGRISPVAPLIAGDWQQAEPRLHTEIRQALLEWQPGSDPIP